MFGEVYLPGHSFKLIYRLSSLNFPVNLGFMLYHWELSSQILISTFFVTVIRT